MNAVYYYNVLKDILSLRKNYMKVDDTKTVFFPGDKEHAIEFGKASWNLKDKSIRRRKNNENGTYDPISSSEIPIHGPSSIVRLINECLKIDWLNEDEKSEILNHIIESNKRQGHTFKIMP